MPRSSWRFISAATRPATTGLFRQQQRACAGNRIAGESGAGSLICP
jgi:hypothetical protein